MKKPTHSPQDRAFAAARTPLKNAARNPLKKRSPNAADGEVGESIRAHRLIAGMSQTDLANKLGVSFQQVQKYEKGVNRVGAGRLPQIAEIFNVPISALFSDHAQTSSGRGRASTAPVKLITDPNVLKLLTAYADITDRAIRRCLAELVERIATNAKKNSRK
jgi:transcriptional regulator with XRE-family HTH domain